MLKMTNFEELRTSTGKTFLKIKHDSTENWIYTDWIGYPTPENVKKGALAYLKILKEYNLTSILNDNRNLVGRWDNSLDWVKQVWLPEAVKAGLKKLAHVTLADSLATGAASVMQEFVEQSIDMQVFTDLEEAKDWLRTENN